MPTTMQFYLANERGTETAGQQFALHCPNRCVIYLQGSLGAGKTTWVRGFLHGLGHTGVVKSPTYTLVEPYQLQQQVVYHFDLYRLGAAEELEYIGIRDYSAETAICLIEWPERGAGFIPAADLCIELRYTESGRVMSCTTNSPLAEALLTQVINAASLVTIQN